VSSSSTTSTRAAPLAPCTSFSDGAGDFEVADTGNTRTEESIIGIER
jgi:hypothetical protein